MSTTRAFLVVTLVAAASALLAAPAAAKTLRLGFFDSAYLQPGAEGPTWMKRAKAEGSQILRVIVAWSLVAPTRPAGAGTDPADPAYDWRAADAAVRAVAAGGEQTLITISAAPAWAEGPNRPPTSQVTAGAWMPDPQAFGAFAQAAATRYSGSFPDPAHPGSTLPAVRSFQAWNEPNLAHDLSPQWSGSQPFSPGHYRSMLNAFFAGVKRAAPRDTVVTAGTAPFGDTRPGADRIPPVDFWREALSQDISFDALAHHPYSIGGPTSGARNPGDVSVPDIHKLTRLVNQARRGGRLDPPGPKPVWVTELSWDSNPPDPDGVPVATQARWLAEAFAVLSRQGVSTITWFGLRDQTPTPSYAATTQGGVFFRSGRAKPSARAFRFPFVADRIGRGRVRLWARAPKRGRVVFEARGGRGWKPFATRRARAGQIVQLTRVQRARILRARVAHVTSLPFRAG